MSNKQTWKGKLILIYTDTVTTDSSESLGKASKDGWGHKNNVTSLPIKYRVPGDFLKHIQTNIQITTDESGETLTPIFNLKYNLTKIKLS